MRLPSDPSILVLLVATDGARWLPDVLRGLRAQRHRPVKAVAVDNASTDGSGEILAKAFGARRVVTLERRAGYGRALAAALKVAAERGLDADAFLLLHDDAALEAGAVEAMVEAMRGEGVGIVGAKLVEWDDPAMLQDIGQSTDRYGRAVSRVERGEVDQGQHDGVHEVLYATSAVMLVAREVVERVGLFDVRYVALRDDLDLCWRARLAGYRTVVTSGAAARHAAASVREHRASPVAGRVRYFGDRNMIATLIKNYGLARLALALPVTMGASMVNALLYLVTGRRRSAMQVLEALQWNIVHLPATVRARVRAQHTRTVKDAEVTRLMRRGATRMRGQFERAVEKVVGQVEEGSDEDLERPPPRLVERVRTHPGAAAILATIVVGTIGARALFVAGPLAGVDFYPFPKGAGAFFAEYASGWRDAGAGVAGPATPGLVLLGVLTFLCFGSAWLAQRALLLGLALVAAVTTFRLARALGLGPAGRRVAVVLSVASPLALGAFGAGRLPDLVLAASAPALLTPLLRACGVLPGAGWRSTAAGMIGLAVVASLAPWALVFAAGAAVLLTVLHAAGSGEPGAVAAGSDVLSGYDAGRAVGRSRARAAVVLRPAAIIVGGALALLFPWSFELFRAGSPLGAGGADPVATMLDVIGLSTGVVRPLPALLTFGLAAAALAGIATAPPARRRAVVLLGGVAAVSILVAWAVARGVPWIAPRPTLPLAGAAVVLPLFAAMAFEAAGPLLSRRAFGAPHVAAAVVGLMLLGHVAFAAGWIARGDYPGIVESGTLVPSFFRTEAAAERGAFRLLWVGGSAATPRARLTGPEGETMTGYLARPAGARTRTLRAAVARMTGGATEAAGRMLAPFGVRYVLVRPDADPSLADAVARQGDLSFSQRFHGGVIYRNEARVPASAATPPAGWGGQPWHRAALVLQALLLAAFCAGWSQRAARERGER